MANFEGLVDSQTEAVPPGAYAKLSTEQMASAARYGIQRSYPAVTRLYR